MTAEANQKTAKSRYTSLHSTREPFLRRGRNYAALTIPSLLPPNGHNSTADLPQPSQGFGARAVVYLAARLMTAILPTSLHFFGLDIPSEVLLQNGEETIPPELRRQLANVEGMIHSEVERKHWRSPTYTALQHLIVAGNCLEHLMPDNTLRVYRLDQYVVVRDPVGLLTEFVIEERLTFDSLDEELRALVSRDKIDNPHGHIGLYTWGRRKPDGSWEVHQELEDQVVPESKGTYASSEVLPFSALRWGAIQGEDYGRGKVEEHEADLRALDGLSQSLIEGAALASLHYPFIKPNASSGGALNVRRQLERARNGSPIIADPDDVDLKSFANAAGMQVTWENVSALRQELGAAFMLHSAARRDAERVTAFEVQQVAQELEGTLGGVYSMLSQEMLLPRIRRLIFQLQRARKIPPWPPGTVEPVVLVGLEAISKERDVSSVQSALSAIQALPPEVMDYVDWPSILVKMMTGLGLNDVIRSESDVQQVREQRAMMQAAAAAVPPVAGNLTSGAA